MKDENNNNNDDDQNKFKDSQTEIIQSKDVEMTELENKVLTDEETTTEESDKLKESTNEHEHE